jgi:hypothetical protein
LGLIKTNLFNAKRDLAQQILQEANQKTQILKLANQIRQLDDYLQRFGKPEDVELEALGEVFKFLQSLEINKTSREISKDFDPEEMFREVPNRPYRKLERGIVVDGKVVAERDSQVYAPEVVARRSLEHFRDVQAAALKKRSSVKKQISLNFQKLEQAETSSEVQKLAIVIGGLQSQLAATDSEIQFAASEATTRYYQHQIEKDVKSQG